MTEINLHVDELDDDILFDEDFDFDSEHEIDFDDGFSSGIPDAVDTLIINANITTFDSSFGYTNRYPKNYGSLQDAAIAITNGKIVWIGSNFAALDYIENQSNQQNKTQVYDAKWKWLTPGLIDCHTHLVHAGNRSMEFEARLEGVDYVEIAKQGGGILSTVRATREASEQELYEQSEKRLQALMSEGVTSIEIKSGYGLNLETEEKILKVARKLGEDYGITIKTTFLAAYTLPVEYQDKDEYIEKVCEWLPILHQQGLVDAVDGFIDDIGFNTDHIRKVFDVAQSLGLPVKAHAEQRSNMGGTRLVSEYNGLSSSHLEYLEEGDVMRMATSDTVAILLPGAFYTMKDEVLPPIHLLRDNDVCIAVSSDCNPGTSPMSSLLLSMNMACNLFSLTPAEALAGTTYHAAKALDLGTKGKIAVGMDADILVWDIERPADLCYQIGMNPLNSLMVNGKWRLKK